MPLPRDIVARLHADTAQATHSTQIELHRMGHSELALSAGHPHERYQGKAGSHHKSPSCGGHRGAVSSGFAGPFGVLEGIADDDDFFDESMLAVLGPTHSLSGSVHHVSAIAPASSLL